MTMHVVTNLTHVVRTFSTTTAGNGRGCPLVVKLIFALFIFSSFPKIAIVGLLHVL